MLPILIDAASMVVELLHGYGTKLHIVPICSIGYRCLKNEIACIPLFWLFLPSSNHQLEQEC